ncbi:uncharacterized protein BX663DRAFT_561595 [Cokeromyces recurvatus]|uniref:uncharacterized protein n=1 Tax=Cokeromyces recurvatus TaxID=90255 RepID=UPI002220F1B1|nr:uncharacterized protein BX663DRAFT_561595 [Cokeromyces recurvatus]KAI7902505.1 hypothetical protein BX663DRAFT_561595 [Cokeromyces recurvatus]
MASQFKTATLDNIKRFAPHKLFVQIPPQVPSIAHAREIFKTLGKYGPMIEYTIKRCPETHRYLHYGFVVYKHSEDANKALEDQFIKVQSELFDKPFEVKVERSTIKNARINND